MSGENAFFVDERLIAERYSHKRKQLSSTESQSFNDIERQMHCIDSDLRAEYSYTLMTYLNYAATAVFEMPDVSEKRRDAASALMRLTKYFIMDDNFDRLYRTRKHKDSWHKTSNARSLIVSAKLAQSFADTFGGLSQQPISDDDYQSGLEAVRAMRTASEDCFSVEFTRSILPDPTVVEFTQQIDHDEQRVARGISSYDLQNPRMFMSWLIVTAVLYASRVDRYTTPQSYVSLNDSFSYEKANVALRKDMTSLAETVYRFGYAPDGDSAVIDEVLASDIFGIICRLPD
jgi:hypothetical protein